MRLQYIAACVAAVLFAALAPALVFSILGGAYQPLPLLFAIALAHAVVVGVPLFLIFRAKGWVNVLSCIGGGFLVGALPFGLMALLSMFDRGSSTSIGGVPTVINGVPTLAGWMHYGQLLLILGVPGALGGFIFWLTLRSFGDVRPGKARSSRSFGAITAAALAILAAGAVFAIPTITKDRTCHNTLRDGRSFISPQTSFRVEIGIDEWPKLTQAMQDVGAKHALSFRNQSGTQPGVQLLYLSMCSERGFNISVAEQRWAQAPHTEFDKTVSVAAYEMTPGSGWQQPTRELVASLEKLWPGRIQFKDASGKTAPMPKELQAPN